MHQQLATRSPAPRLIAVVKANGYGHDAVQAARLMAECGVDFFAVTTAAEALELRDAGIVSASRAHATGEGTPQSRKAPEILAFAPPPMPAEAEAMIDRNIAITVADAAGLGIVTAAAAKVGKPASVHLKIDTGMGRLGLLPADALPIAQAVAAGPTTQLAGVYTHFGQALDKNFAPTLAQFSSFQAVLSQLQAAQIEVGLRHCANSAATLRDSALWLDAVRAGTILYGQYPSADTPRLLKLQNTWQLKTRVVSVRNVPAGTAVGYGAEFVTRRPSRLAILPLGYADGVTLAPASVMSGWRGVKSLLREMSGKSKLTVTIHGKPAPVLGRVAMQMFTVDITHIENVSVGDIATVPTRRLAASAKLIRIYED